MSSVMSSNGSLLDGKYIPEELLSKIFCYLDHKTLLSCHLVCKYWYFIIKDVVWRKKAEQSLSRFLPVDKLTPWMDYFFICVKKPFNKNLIKNHSGADGMKKHWRVTKSGGNGWAVECPPVGVPPLPDDPVFEGERYCFVTSFWECSKHQIINLIDEGFSIYLLDKIQPKIKMSEWYSSRWDCSAIYECAIELLGENETADPLHKHVFNRSMVQENVRCQWFKFTHEFKNYGPGVRKIRFTHGGRDGQNWAGYYGSKMAGAYIELELPESKKISHSTTSS